MFVSREGTILHADLDAFFASVEQRDDRRLRGRPVIVGMGVVLSASYEARAYGIRTAMGGGQARRLCPHAAVVRPRMSAYSEASKAVFEVFDDTSPLVEGLSIDEAFLDVRGLEHIRGTPTEIAVQLRSDVAEHVGLPITVGVARTKFLAKVASAVGGNGFHAWPRDRPATPRTPPQPRSPAEPGRPPPGVDRIATRTRSPDAEDVGSRRCRGDRLGRPRHPAAAGRRPRRPHRRPAAAL
jgi:hypothetical protein